MVTYSGQIAPTQLVTRLQRFRYVKHAVYETLFKDEGVGKPITETPVCFKYVSLITCSVHLLELSES